MTAQTYEAWTRPLRRRPRLTRLMLRMNRVLTALLYALYPLLLAALLVSQDGRLLRCILTPGVSFAAVTIFRAALNCPRPYEALDITPLIHKKTRGHSFPSRHVFSSAVISCAFLYVVPPLGMLLLAVTALLAVIRVLGGVHFPRDVIFGFCIGLLAGLIGFVLL